MNYLKALVILVVVMAAVCGAMADPEPEAEPSYGRGGFGGGRFGGGGFGGGGFGGGFGGRGGYGGYGK